MGFVGRLRIPYSTFLKIESGYTPNPSIQAVLNIAEALSVSIDELVGRRARGLNKHFVPKIHAGPSACPTRPTVPVGALILKRSETRGRDAARL